MDATDPHKYINEAQSKLYGENRQAPLQVLIKLN